MPNRIPTSMRPLAPAAAALATALLAGAAGAQPLQLSIGIRETGNNVPIGSDGGTSNGIEWVNRDGYDLPLDGQWRTVSINIPTGTLTPFAGLGANGVLDTTIGTLEQIRIRSNGNDGPITFWLDEISVSVTGGTFLLTGFEGFAAGTEVMFHEPGHSGSTSANLLPGSTAGVDTSVAFAGSNSYRADMQFVDADPDRWVRFYTFNADNLPNPTIPFNNGATVNFTIRAIPAPGALPLLALAALPATRRRRR